MQESDRRHQDQHRRFALIVAFICILSGDLVLTLSADK
jgi:hypothetical protein